MSIENNEVINFNYDSKNPIFQTDSTIIDSPIALSLNGFFSLFNRSSSRSRGRIRRSFPLQYMDLTEKFSEIDGSPSPIISNPEILEEIKKIINGTVEYNRNRRTFSFSRPNQVEINISNLATGIKSFVVLQLLLLSGNINPHSILIIDEPEIHLHPKWEIEYARIIVELSKAGIPIIISTHSPYFIKALTVYSKNYQITENIKVYYGKANESGLTTFDDITLNLQPFLITLSEPMQQLFLDS